MDKLRNMLSRNYEHQEDEGAAAAGSSSNEERGIIAEALDASSLSWSTRIKGFAACFVIGMFISVLATVTFAIGFSLTTFGMLYSLGNIVSIASTLFLMGPVNQIKRMFNSSRWIATSIMLLCLFLTLFSAFYLKKKGLTVLFCLLQFCAMTWYSLSYIPYARDAVKKFASGILG